MIVYKKCYLVISSRKHMKGGMWKNNDCPLCRSHKYYIKYIVYIYRVFGIQSSVTLHKMVVT